MTQCEKPHVKCLTQTQDSQKSKINVQSASLNVHRIDCYQNHLLPRMLQRQYTSMVLAAGGALSPRQTARTALLRPAWPWLAQWIIAERKAFIWNLCATGDPHITTQMNAKWGGGAFACPATFIWTEAWNWENENKGRLNATFQQGNTKRQELISINLWDWREA